MMAIVESAAAKTGRFFGSSKMGKYVPILDWGKSYQRSWLAGDLMAGVIVAIMLVPQAMAYALLAGLPPQVGLYASILPLLIYSVLGSSRTLSVGPVAIVSILVASGVGELAAGGSAEYVQLAITLALMAGVLQLAMGLLRIGFLVNFLSHPVLVGFTSAAALVIGASQLKHLLGLSTPRASFFQTLALVGGELRDVNGTTLLLGGVALAILIFFKRPLATRLTRLGVSERVAVSIVKSGPLVVVLLGTLVVALFHLDTAAEVKIVGEVPSGLPRLSRPDLDQATWRMLLPTALAISFVSFMQSTSAAKTLACKKRQKVDSGQELVALGVANLGAAFSGGYPVTGGFSRSVVNYEAGANTGFASIITALLIAVTVIFLTPLFYFLPRAVLAAIIIVAVAGLVDVNALRHIWRYNKADGVSMIVTFLAVLVIGVEKGILVGMAVALLQFIWRTSQPHVTVVGRLGDSELYRSVDRFKVETCPNVVALRIDASLYFANAKLLEDAVLGHVADAPESEHLLLIGTAVNLIDASALETLESLHRELSEAGVTFHLAAIKGPVLDRLKRIGFVDRFGHENIHLSTHDAMKAIGCFR